MCPRSALGVHTRFGRSDGPEQVLSLAHLESGSSQRQGSKSKSNRMSYYKNWGSVCFNYDSCMSFKRILRTVATFLRILTLHAWKTDTILCQKASVALVKGLVVIPLFPPSSVALNLLFNS